MWPGWAWHKLYEPAIRAMAGLGRPPRERDPDRYATRYAHCDVLVVGAGPAGLAAAMAASEAGARVILCDEQEELGGSLLSRPDLQLEGKLAWSWLADATAQLRARANVRLLPRTTAFAYQVQNFRRLAGARCRPRIRGSRKPAAAAAVAGARPPGRPRNGSHRAADRLPGQRQAGDHAGRRRAGLCEPLRRVAGPPCGRRRGSRRGLSRRSGFRAGRGRGRRDCRSAIGFPSP